MRVPTLIPLLATLLLAPAGAKSQTLPPIQGPVLGYLWDQQLSGIRPIFGIPGSSTLGPVLDLGVVIRGAEISQAQDYALAVDASGRLLLVDLQAASLSARTIETTPLRPPDRIFLSPTGASAALYYREAASVQVVKGLPAAPSLGSPLDLSSLPNLLTALAISDSGDVLLAAIPEGLYALAAGGTPPVLVSPTTSISATSFLDNSHDAVVAARSRNEVLWIRDVAGAAAQVLLAGERDGIADPIAIAGSKDRRRVFIGSNGGVAILELGGGPPVLLPCDCSPSGLYRLAGDSVFRLNDPSSGPMFLLDASSREPRVLFIPGFGSPPASAVRAPRARRSR